MTFEELATKNLARCTSPQGFNHALNSWKVSQWTNAGAGEQGEACNLAKKLDRLREGVRGNLKAADQSEADITARLGEELADIVIYADLTAQRLGLSLGECLKTAWNRKSEQLGYPERLGALADAGDEPR